MKYEIVVTRVSSKKYNPHFFENTCTSSWSTLSAIRRRKRKGNRINLFEKVEISIIPKEK